MSVSGADPQAIEGLPEGYFIRPYQAGDAKPLILTEARAGQLFAKHGYEALAEEPPRPADAFEHLALENHSLVAVRQNDCPVGFAIAGMIGAYLHLKELSVDPAHGQRGLGTCLLHAVIAMSLTKEAMGVSLTTFRNVPFNAPFYGRHGFVECRLNKAPEILRARFAAEVPSGIDPSARVLLLRNNQGSAELFEQGAEI